MPRGSYEDRHRRNDESRNRAGHHREPWDATELEILLLWSGSEEELIEVAELIGRTVEACRQRFYEARRGEVTVTRTERIETTTRITVRWSDEDEAEWPRDQFPR